MSEVITIEKIELDEERTDITVYTATLSTGATVAVEAESEEAAKVHFDKWLEDGNGQTSE